MHFAATCSNWKMTFRKPVATTWKMNENQFRQMFLNPWHMLSSIWVHFGLWRCIFTVKIWFSHIFPASAWSPYQSLFLRHEIEKGLRAVYLFGQKARFGPKLQWLSSGIKTLTQRDRFKNSNELYADARSEGTGTLEEPVEVALPSIHLKISSCISHSSPTLINHSSHPPHPHPYLKLFPR